MSVFDAAPRKTRLRPQFNRTGIGYLCVRACMRACACVCVCVRVCVCVCVCACMHACVPLWEKSSLVPKPFLCVCVFFVFFFALFFFFCQKLSGYKARKNRSCEDTCMLYIYRCNTRFLRVIRLCLRVSSLTSSWLSIFGISVRLYPRVVSGTRKSRSKL